MKSTYSTVPADWADKPCEIYKKICDMYEEACFSKKYLHTWAKLFKEGQNYIQDEDSSGRLTMSSIPVMMDSDNALILANIRVTIVDISVQLDFL